MLKSEVNKRVIISYGHLDPVLPLFVHLNKFTHVEMIIIFAQTAKTESLLSFNDIDVPDGFVGEKQTIQILSRIGMGKHYPQIRIFMLHTNKVRSFKNYILYLQLRNQLISYGLVHFNGQHVTLIPFYNMLPKKIKKVFTVHDYKSHSGERGKYYFFGCAWNNKKILNTKWPVVIQNQADMAVVKNENSHAVNRLHFIPFGVFDNYKRWIKPEAIKETYDVLFFGRVSDYKGLRYLLEAVLELQQKKYHISLCVAGSGSLQKYKQVISKIQHIEISNNYIQNEKLVALIQASKIVVCPYTDATQSGVAMTAFAIGKPVIATSVGGFPDVIEDGKTGYLVPPENSISLAGKIGSLINDDKKRLDMQKNILQFSQHPVYGWDSIAEKYYKLYQSL